MNLTACPLALPIFQRAIDYILSGFQRSELYIYMDDIVLYDSFIVDHENKLRKLLARLQDAGLTLQPEKGHVLRKEVTLGISFLVKEYGPIPRN